MKKRAKRKVTLMVPMDVLDRLRKVAQLSGTTTDTVVNVILALEILKLKEQQGKNKA